MFSTPQRAFLLDCIDEYGTRKLTADAVQLTEDGILTPSYRRWEPASELTHLQVSANLTPDEPHACGFSARYRDVARVDLDHAQAMARVLGRIQRGMTRLRSEIGPPEGFHTYLLHIGSILGIRHYLIRLAERDPDGKRYRRVDSLGVGDRIRQQEQRYAGTSHGAP